MAKKPSKKPNPFAKGKGKANPFAKKGAAKKPMKGC